MSSPAFSCLLFLTSMLSLTCSLTSASVNNLTAYQVLEQYDFPIGLLPQGVTGYEIDTSTGKFKVYLPETCSYKIDGYELKYKSTIAGTISTDKIKNLTGVSVKVLFLWLNIGEITRDGDEIEFSVGITSANFDLDGFDECPQCGCGFDCVNRNRFNGFISYLFE